MIANLSGLINVTSLFQMLKDMLCSAPIMKYPDTSKLYTLCTDTSKYGWAGVLTQSHMSTVDGERNHYGSSWCHMSVVYFDGSQLSWAALKKEAYAIYMSVKKSTILPYRT